jgi:sarcosine oxidase subunit beta
MSSIGFGLSPATGHAVRDLVVDGVCGFADLSSLRLSRFDRLEADWIDRQGWRPASPRAGSGTDEGPTAPQRS